MGDLLWSKGQEEGWELAVQLSKEAHGPENRQCTGLQWGADRVSLFRVPRLKVLSSFY